MNPKPTTIADLIRLDIKPEVRKRREPVVTPLSAALRCPEGAKLPRKFEYDVFNFLLAKKDALDIETVFKFKNLFVDGAVQLVGGRRLAVEVKLRMNWTKALQAESEFRRFLLTAVAKAHPVNGQSCSFRHFRGPGGRGKPRAGCSKTAGTTGMQITPTSTATVRTCSGSLKGESSIMDWRW